MDVPLQMLRRSVLLVDALADLDDPADFAGLVLPQLARLVGCDVITYNEIGLEAGQIRYADYPCGIRDPGMGEVLAAHLHEHPLVAYYRRTHDPGPAKISDFLSQQQFHNLGLYTDFYRNVAVEHQMAAALPAPPGTQVVGLALNRSRTDFSESDRAVLSAMHGPLVAGLERARARHRARLALAASAPTSDTGPSGLTDREAQILRLVAAGRTNTAIARTLDVSPRTVAKHLEHIYRKLGVTSRAAAVSRAAGGQGAVADAGLPRLLSPTRADRYGHSRASIAPKSLA
jgi:DNA-binding CsgD family transcriptional regulator